MMWEFCTISVLSAIVIATGLYLYHKTTAEIKKLLK